MTPTPAAPGTAEATSAPATVAAVQASIAIGAAHVQAERTNELDTIMATIGEQPYFPLLDHDGAGGLVLNVVTTTEAARSYYGERGATYDIVDSRHVVAVASDWYTFRESVATLRHTGAVGGLDGHGELFQVNSAVLFPTGPDGIAGEIVWTRYPFGDIVRGTVAPAVPVPGPGHLPTGQLRNADIHDRFVAGVTAGDAEAVASCLAPDVHWLARQRPAGAPPTYTLARGNTETALLIEQWLATWRYEQLAVLNRVVTDWYVMAEYYVAVAPRQGGASERWRKVALYPLAGDGRIRAEMSDTVAASHPA